MVNSNAKTCFSSVLLGALLLTPTAQAFAVQVASNAMPGMAMSSGKANASTKSYKAAMDAMMQGMMAQPTGAADKDFVMGMIPHHQGAIAMADVELKFGKDKTLRQLARNISTAQKTEIGQMQAWQKSTDKNAMQSSAEAKNAAAAPMQKMMAAMAIKYSANADVDFARGMIPHHQGAIDMAKVEMQYGSDPEIKKLAQAIMDAQGPEIKMMQDWQRSHKG